jgi:plasmid stability protein
MEPPLMERLRRRAKRDRVTVEEEARKILWDAVRTEKEKKRAAVGLGTRIHNRFKMIGLRAGEEIKELRGHVAQPAKLPAAAATESARQRFKRELDEDRCASKADYEAGRYLGPFDDADDMIRALREAPISKTKASTKRSTTGSAKSANASSRIN